MLAAAAAQACAHWPSAEIADLIVRLKALLDQRSQHNAEGGGIADEIASHPRRTHEDHS
jgi:hypothetical protein